MTDCTPEKLMFPDINKRKIEVNFEGGEVTSDGGVLLLREADKKLNLLSKVAKILPDNRNPLKIEHSNLDLLSQRVISLGLGYEDLNDHQELRLDTLFQESFAKDKVAASPSTLCRFENRMNRKTCVDIHKIMFDTFVNSFDEPPEELILDFDATDDLVYGKQDGRAFNSYYGGNCFLPLHVFCNDHLLVSYLRPGKCDGAKHSIAIFRILANALRKKWPQVKIIFRGDSGFARKEIMDFCERKGFYYITGFGKNTRVAKLAEFNNEIAKQNFEEQEEEKTNCVVFDEFKYGARSWKKERKVIVKSQYGLDKTSTRLILTNIDGDPESLYKDVYCERGQMENGIKLVKLQLFSDRTSCSDFEPNQFRLMLSSLAYILMHYIRTVASKGTQLEGKEFNTIRLKLFKIGAVITKNTRRLKVMLSSYYPYQILFKSVYLNLVGS